MTYTEALERAKSTPVMRPHWCWIWLTYNKGKHVLLNDNGQETKWNNGTKADREATDWIEAPKNKSLTDPE